MIFRPLSSLLYYDYFCLGFPCLIHLKRPTFSNQLKGKFIFSYRNAFLRKYFWQLDKWSALETADSSSFTIDNKLLVLCPVITVWHINDSVAKVAKLAGSKGRGCYYFGSLFHVNWCGTTRRTVRPEVSADFLKTNKGSCHICQQTFGFFWDFVMSTHQFMSWGSRALGQQHNDTKHRNKSTPEWHKKQNNSFDATV